MKKIISCVILASSIVLAGGVQAASIDNFDGGAHSVTGLGVSSDTINYAGAIGGSRKIEIDITNPNEGDAKARVYNSATYNSGVYSHSAEALTAATSTITWDANGAGLGGIDLTDGRDFSVFSFDIFRIDQGEVNLTFSVLDTLGNAVKYTLSGAGVGVQAVAFDLFTGDMGFDFESVNAISLEIEGDDASDLVLDNLRTVPTPATLMLMLASFAGFFFNKKQQNPVLMA